jgi:hypothetical protein
MRVNIQFSVDLDDIPEHVITLLGDADDLVDNVFSDKAVLSNEVRLFIDNKNYTDAINYLGSVRDKLVSIDHRIDDCMRILIGYHQYIANPENIIDPDSEQNRQLHMSPAPAQQGDSSPVIDGGGFE